MNTKLYVGNLSYSSDQHRLREAFGPYGNVISATVVSDRETGRSRGFGFVEYASAEEAQRALEATNGLTIDGRSLKVNIAHDNGRGGGQPRPRGNRGLGDRPARDDRPKRW
jgi:RNA recognition motif-containing protein